MASILVVDDDLLVLEFTGEALTELGYEVIMASGPEQAMQMLQQDKDVQLLITDVQMPCDGNTLASRAHELRNDLKIDLMSGASQPQGAWPLLQKPISREQLSNLVQTLRIH